MNTYSLLIFTLNELEGMKCILPKIKSNWVDEIIVIDGGSTDGTIEYALEKGLKLHIQQREGLRHAYREILSQITTDYVIPFSPDGNSLPEKIPELIIEANKGYSMVTCSRYLPPAKSYDDDVITAFGNWIFTKSINFFHGSRYTDAMVMYRAIKTDVFQTLGLLDDAPYDLPEKLFRTKICLMPLLSIRAARFRLPVTEIPGDEPPRIGGERKLKIIKWGLAYYSQVLLETIRKPERH